MSESYALHRYEVGISHLENSEIRDKTLWLTMADYKNFIDYVNNHEELKWYLEIRPYHKESTMDLLYNIWKPKFDKYINGEKVEKFGPKVWVDFFNHDWDELVKWRLHTSAHASYNKDGFYKFEIRFSVSSLDRSPVFYIDCSMSKKYKEKHWSLIREFAEHMKLNVFKFGGKKCYLNYYNN